MILTRQLTILSRDKGKNMIKKMLLLVALSSASLMQSAEAVANSGNQPQMFIGSCYSSIKQGATWVKNNPVKTLVAFTGVTGTGLFIFNSGRNYEHSRTPQITGIPRSNVHVRVDHLKSGNSIAYLLGNDTDKGTNPILGIFSVNRTVNLNLNQLQDISNSLEYYSITK